MKRYTRVQIAEKAPKAEQIEQLIKDNSAQLPKIIQAFAKYSARLIEVKKRIKPANQERQRKTAIKYEMIRRFAGQLITADPKLQRASANHLAKKIHKQRPHWPDRTIRRALSSKK
jgi:hypothetical protein